MRVMDSQQGGGDQSHELSRLLEMARRGNEVLAKAIQAYTDIAGELTEQQVRHRGAAETEIARLRGLLDRLESVTTGIDSLCKDALDLRKRREALIAEIGTLARDALSQAMRFSEDLTAQEQAVKARLGAMEAQRADLEEVMRSNAILVQLLANETKGQVN